MRTPSRSALLLVAHAPRRPGFSTARCCPAAAPSCADRRRRARRSNAGAAIATSTPQALSASAAVSPAGPAPITTACVIEPSPMGHVLRHPSASVCLAVRRQRSTMASRLAFYLASSDGCCNKRRSAQNIILARIESLTRICANAISPKMCDRLDSVRGFHATREHRKLCTFRFACLRFCKECVKPSPHGTAGTFDGITCRTPGGRVEDGKFFRSGSVSPTEKFE